MLNFQIPSPQLRLTSLSVISLAVTTIISGCGGASSGIGSIAGVPDVNNPVTCTAPFVPNSDNTICILPEPTPEPPAPEPLQCDAPQVPNSAGEVCINPTPTITASDNQAILYYFRADGNYDEWKLHAWNNEACDAYNDDFVANITWDNGAVVTGVEANYGAYWVLPLKENFTDCANFIIHNGGLKDPSDDDQILGLTTTERWSFVISGVGTFVEPTLASNDLPLIIDGASAHWLDEKTFVTNITVPQDGQLKLLFSHTAELTNMPLTSELMTADNSVNLQPVSLTSAQQALVPHLAQWSAFSHSLTKGTVKALLQNQLAVAALDNTGKVLGATYVQAAKVLDDIYTSGSDDADEANLGAIFNADGTITVSVWAPTAQNVNLALFDASQAPLSSAGMTLNPQTGIWSMNLAATSDRQYYRYEVVVYHPLTKAIETVWATDPYSVNLSSNGKYSQLVNLMAEDLKPAGWDNHTVPTIAHPEDAIIYEGHIRDFSALDNTVSAANRGKYLAFTETESQPVKHLKAMADSGLTHFHLLPTNDIATIKEPAVERVDINDTVGRLCEVNSSAPVCGVNSAEMTLVEVLKSYDPASADAQALAQSMRGIDGFNWGYDPHHFNAPEGSYASNPEGVQRIVEMRAMVQSLHQLGLRTVMDVVYNHTSGSGLADTAVFDKIVPGYYHRYNEVSGTIERSTCCENTASEHRMFGKFVADSLVMWAKHYRFDGFRFDIMGHMPKALMLSARDKVRAIDEDTYFYGEGWNFGEVASDRLFEQAVQNNLNNTEIGTFNDRYRDTIREGKLFAEVADLTDVDHIRLGLAGTLKDYVLIDEHGTAKKGSTFAQASYADDPADIVNYVSKHDNRTLWDELQLGLPTSMTLNQRVRAQNIAAAIPLLSQGVPFFQLGVDMLRSKSLDRNSYDAGDWFNRVDFSMQSNNWNVGLPLASDNEGNWSQISEMIASLDAQVAKVDIQFANSIFNEFMRIRSTSGLFRLTTGEEVMTRVGFHNTGESQTPGLIVMSINDGIGLTDLDPANDAIVVVINGTNATLSHQINTAAGFVLHPLQQSSVDGMVKTASFSQADGQGSFTVPAMTIAVFVKPQGDAQGEGLAANPNEIPVPFGDTEIFLRGINSWDPVNLMAYQGNGIYGFSTTLTAGSYEFKIADADWASVNLGFADVAIAQDSIPASANGENILVELPSFASYNFTIDASVAVPVVSVTIGNQIIACNALDTVEGYPFSVAGGGQLFVRGSHSGWEASPEYAMAYKGQNRYQAVAQFAGDMQFKLASDDGSWTTQLFASNGQGEINTANLQLDAVNQVTFGNAGTENNHANLAAGSYSFLLTLNEANPTAGNNVGTLVVQQCSN